MGKISTTQQKVDRKKWEDNWDRIFNPGIYPISKETMDTRSKNCQCDCHKNPRVRHVVPCCNKPPARLDSGPHFDYL